MRFGTRGIREPSNTPSSQSSRSDSVRQRRGQRTSQRATSAASRAASPAQPRPVVVRGMLNHQSQPLYRQAAQSNPRRTFYVAMDSHRATGVSGAELRLPAIPLVNPGWRLISGLLVFAVIFAIFSVWNSPFFRVQQVSIQGLQRLTAADLDTVIHLQNLSIVEIRPDKVKEEIAIAFPELADVQVDVELPNFVTVTARERQPLMAWQKGDSAYWIDAEGFIFPVRGEGGPLVTIQGDDDIPLLPMEPAPGSDQASDSQAQAKEQPAGSALLTSLGAATAPAYLNRRADMKILNASLQLAKLLPEGTQIMYHKENGMGWTDSNNCQVFIGKDLENFEAKLTTYQAILQDLQNQGVQPELISVEHLSAPFYRAPEVQQTDEGQ